MRARPPEPHELEPVERASRDELIALQTERLRASLGAAYDNVEHYRRRFDEAGVHPRDLRSLADLSRYPFTIKDDLRAHYPYGMFAVPRETLVRLHASSGTTGRPTVVGYTAADIELWAHVMARSLRAAGGRAGDVLHNAYGYGLFTGGLGLHYGAERLGCTCVPVSGGMTERQVRLIADLEPAIICATPSYLLAIADEFGRQGVDARATALRVGVLGAEPWSEGMRADIEARFDIDAVNVYGLSEIIGPGVAVECVETKDGLTVWEDHFYPEIVDPETGVPVAEGERGELVLTTLTKQAQPMIRYRTRDLTRLLPPTARAMRRIDRITGRSDDMLIVRGMNVFPSQFEEVVVARPELSAHYYVEVRRDRRLDSLTLVVEAGAALGASGAEAMTEAGSALAHDVRSKVGIGVEVRIEPPGGVERSMGKARRVVDLRAV